MKKNETGTLDESRGHDARFTLVGKPLYAGDALELRVEGDRWIPVNYGWSTREEGSPVVLARTGSAGRRTCLRIPEGAELRWAQ